MTKQFTALALLFLTIGLWNSCPAQSKERVARRSERIDKSRELSNIRMARQFADRARTFRDLSSKAVTLVNIASLLWEHKDQQTFAREIFVNLHDELKLASSSQSQLTAPSNERGNIPRLQQMVARFLSKHDPTLARAWLDELIESDVGDMRARRQLDFALSLAAEGSSEEANHFAQKAVETGFSGLDVRLVITLLHRLRLNDPGSADALFAQVLGQLAQQPLVTGEDLLLIGNYLFIDDSNVGPDFIRYSPIRIGDFYFPVGIAGERSGLSRPLVNSYLRAGLAILSRQLLKREELQFPRRYEAVARMLLLKAEKFSPELVSSFTAIARDFSMSQVTDSPTPNNPNSPKVVDYDTVKVELDKLQGIARDEKCLTLVATAYLQGDFDTASRLAELLSTEEERARLKQLIAFRRAINHLEKGDRASAEQAAAKVTDSELTIIVQLGLANVDVKNSEADLALPRLQTVIGNVAKLQLSSRGLYLLTSASLLGKIDEAAALQAFVDAAKALDDSSTSLTELARREHLTSVRIGKTTAFFSVSSSVVPFGTIDEPLISLFRQAPEDTVAVVLRLKNERVLGGALVVLAKELLQNKPA